MARLSISLLGSVQVTVDDAPLRVDTRKAVALLAWLAMSTGRHSRDVLAALLWPETGQSRATLRRTLSTLHNALGQRWLSIDRDSVAFVPDDDVWIDVTAFREQVAAGDTASLERAISLQRGDFMAGFSLRDSLEFDDWVSLQAEGLRRELTAALERLVHLRCAARQFEPAVQDARRLLALDPLHEEAHRLLMQAFVWVGDRAAALRQYRECVRVLDSELGVAPLDETTALYQMILEHRVPPLPDPEPSPAREQPRGPAKRADATTAPSMPLVGRDDAFLALRSAWQSSREHGRLAVVHGEAGIGKTRLAETLIAHARERGAPVIVARCYEGESSLAYGPFIEGLQAALSPARTRADALSSLPDYVLADGSRLLPYIAATRAGQPPPLDGPGAMARFYGSLLALLDALLAGDAPGILFVDDAQWLDAASLELLGFIARRVGQHTFYLLVAWRDEQVGSDHPLRRLQADATRQGHALDLPLERLRAGDVGRLVRDVVAGDGERDDLVERLFRETEGLPFFLTEYLREVLRQPERGGSGWALPGGVRDMLRQRLASVTPIESQLLTTLATAGRSCTFDLLREASGRSIEEAVGAIEGLLARGLVVEQSAASDALYDFSHERLREIVYADTSLARRRLVHRRIADALLAPARGSALAQVAPQVALHYRLAGVDAEAAEHYRIAGDSARDLHASEDALAHYRTALALGHPDTAHLHVSIGDQCTLLGRFDEAFDAYEAAAALSEGAALGTVEWKLGSLNHRLGRWERAERHFEAAASELSASAGDLARLCADWSLAWHRRGDLPRAMDLARQSFDLASRSENARSLAQANNLLGILSRAAGALDEARRTLEESLRIAVTLDDADARIAALNNLALVHADLDEHERAAELATEALNVCVAVGDRHREAALRSNLADYYHGAGRVAESREQLAASARIYADIGVVAGEHQPEIWKLTEW